MYPSDEVASLVLEILESVRVHRKRFLLEARQRGITLEQLLAAAITEAVRERLAAKAARR
jgi:hypothetical protein